MSETDTPTPLHTDDCVRQRAKFGAVSAKGDVCSCGAAPREATTFTADLEGSVVCRHCRETCNLHTGVELTCPEGVERVEATARPWRVYHNYIHGAEDNKGQRKIIAAITKDAEVAVNESNAALIVQAVNTYDDNQRVRQALVDAAQRALNVLYDDDPATAKAIETLRAALKLAGE